MIDRTHARLMAVFLAGLLVPGVVRAGRSDTDDIFHLLPVETASCLVLEDAADHFDHLVHSSFLARIEQLDVVQEWKKSPTHKSFHSLLASLPIYFGVSNDQLLRDVFGGSVVLAFIPPSNDGPATGILACRAVNEETLVKVVDRITRPTPNRKVASQSHRGVSFVERTEFGARHDFVLKIGAILIVSDKLAAIHKSIDASIGGRSLYDSSTFQEMRSAIGEGAAVQLLMNTRDLAPLVREAMAQAGPVSTVLEHAWSKLDWAAFRLKFVGHAELTLFTSADTANFTESDRAWAKVLGRPSEYWNRVPADAVAALATEMDFVALAHWLHGLGQTIPEWNDLLQATAELVVGFDVDKDVLARLGPQVGAVAVLGPKEQMQVVLEVELRAGDDKSPAGLSLPQTLELTALRPLLVFYSLDHNKQFDDTTQVATIEVEGTRMHSMVGSRRLPVWLQPTYAVHGHRVYFGSSPDAIQSRQTPPRDSLPMSHRWEIIHKALGPDAVLKGYLNVARLRQYLLANQEEWVDRISNGSGEASARVAGDWKNVSAALALIDFVTLSTSTKGNVRGWTLAVFPADSNP